MRLPLVGGLRVIGGLLALGLAALFGVVLARGGGLFAAPRTTITESVVVERLDAVAKLVTTEALVRDIITFENTRLLSTKRTLVVVTGRTLVGLDLGTPPRITIRPADRHISLVLPHARLLGVDITELRTYDETRGLWNPFVASDRDTIYQLARRQLASAARDLAVVSHAEASARQFLTGLFATDGYTIDVRFAPPGRAAAAP